MANPFTQPATWWNALRSQMPWKGSKANSAADSPAARTQAAQAISNSPGRTHPVGYLINRPDGLTGTQGTGYDYVWAGNGIFVQSQSGLITARILISPTATRGLNPTEEKLQLAHGRIPSHILDEGIRWMLEEPETERFFAIAWANGNYHPVYPEQQGNNSSLQYHTPTMPTVAEFHSHGPHQARFSPTDDQDEQAFRIYGVLGNTEDGQHEMKLRLGIYGHHRNLSWSQVIDGPEENTP